MKKIIKRMIALLVMFVITVNGVIHVMATDTSAKIKSFGALADSFTANDGEFTLSASSRFFVASNSEPSGDLLQTVQLAQRQFATDTTLNIGTLNIVWGQETWAKEGDIVIKLDTSSGIATEGYQLSVNGTATVTASDVDGLLYGLNMLQKYFRTVGNTTLTGFTVSDAPDTKERTVMLDCARKYYTKEWICNFIRQISWMGYNAIQLHFSEDGGFRADFWDPTYYTENYSPKNDFSWLCGSYVQSWVKDPYRTDPDAGKYLTTAELVEILKVAKEYHIDVIPSFDSPAHMDYITWKFEQNYKSNNSYSFTYNGTTYKASSTNGCINYTGRTNASSPTWPYYTTIDITDGTMAKAFVFALYADIADFFKEYAGSTDFSIGADEVNLSSEYSPKWSYSQFPGYVNELNRMLNAKGYTCRMFNDFIGSTTYNQSSDEKAIYDFDDNIEIMYWNSDFNPTTGQWNEPIWHVKFFWENNTGTTENWGDGGRTMYNCIQTNCYYVLRVAASNTDYPNMDARNPENYNWTFYHSTEENIYNEWYPADISEKGLCTEEAADVPAEQLGGAYFLIWNDYAALNTEAEVWNDVKDNTGTSNYVYSLFDRMWSNMIKMWNSDINSTVAYDNFATVRDTFGYFPGFTSCSASATFSSATNPTQAYAADHSALEVALSEGKISNDDNKYTSESYANYEKAYEKAYAEATTVNENHAATEEEINAAIQGLEDAKDWLVEVTTEATTEKESETSAEESTEATLPPETEENEEVEENDNLIIHCKTKVNGVEKEIRQLGFVVDTTSTFQAYVKPMTGYVFESIEGATYEPLPSGDGSGFVKGSMVNCSGSVYITVWYTNTPDVSRLNELIRYEESDMGYTAETWNAYQEALNAAKSFSITETTTQSDIDILVENLVKTQTELAVASTGTTAIQSIEKLTETARLGKQVGLKITTTPDVQTITVDGESLTLCVGNVQTLSSGESVKIWLVNFPADQAGTFTYNVHADEVSQTIEVVVK